MNLLSTAIVGQALMQRPHSMQFSKRLNLVRLSGSSTSLGCTTASRSSTLSGKVDSASRVIDMFEADMRWKKPLTSTTRSLTTGKLRSGSRRNGLCPSHTSLKRVMQGSFSAPLMRKPHEPHEEWWQARRNIKV